MPGDDAVLQVVDVLYDVAVVVGTAMAVVATGLSSVDEVVADPLEVVVTASDFCCESDDSTVDPASSFNFLSASLKSDVQLRFCFDLVQSAHIYSH